MKPASPPLEVLPFWRAFLASKSGYDASRFYESFYFADSEPVANHLAELVLSGIKRATAALVWGLESEGKAAPSPGDLSIVTDWSGKPVCVIETLSAEVVPFEEVTAEFAATEGEGDKTLEYWRREHWAFFSRECTQIGRKPSAPRCRSCARDSKSSINRRTRMRPNPSLNPRPATAATAWPLQAMVEIVLPRPVGVCLHGRG